MYVNMVGGGNEIVHTVQNEFIVNSRGMAHSSAKKRGRNGADATDSSTSHPSKENAKMSDTSLTTSSYLIAAMYVLGNSSLGLEFLLWFFSLFCMPYYIYESNFPWMVNDVHILFLSVLSFPMSFKLTVGLCRIENSAREFGVALMDLCAVHTITLTEIHCSASYTQILSFVHCMQPKMILYPNSQSSRLPIQKIKALCSQDVMAEVSSINRSCTLKDQHCPPSLIVYGSKCIFIVVCRFQ